MHFRYGVYLSREEDHPFLQTSEEYVALYNKARGLPVWDSRKTAADGSEGDWL